MSKRMFHQIKKPLRHALRIFFRIFGWLLLHEVMSASELWGCVLVFAAVILSQIPEKKR